MKLTQIGVPSALGLGIALSAALPTAFAQPGADPTASGPAIEITVTASVDPDLLPDGYDLCGESNAVEAVFGQNVRWCYEVFNTGSVTLTQHTLNTERFGNLLVNFPFSLGPGALAFITSVDTPESATESATWAAFNPGPIDVVVAQGSASVNVRAIELRVTVSVDPVPLPDDYDFCGTTDTVVASPGDNLRWCYTISNIGRVALQRHNLVNAAGVVILQDFPFSLQGGASAFITRVETMGSESLSEPATWTSFNPGPVNVFTATDTAVALGETIFADGFEGP